MYWLCITNETNWKVIKEKNIWGVPEKHRNTIAKVKKGDKLLIYLKQEKINDETMPSRIVGAYEVISKPFKDFSRVFSPKGFSKREVFPWRVKIKPIRIFDEPIEFKHLVPNLKFITNKRNWFSHIQGRSMRVIPEDDFNFILKYRR